MWKEQCSLSWTHINSIECSAINAMNILFWEAPPVWIEFKSDNGKLGFEIRHIHWIFWEPNTLIRSPYIWVDNLPHDTEWKPKQTLWPGLDVVSAVSGVSVASGLTFGISPDVSVDVPGFKNIFLRVDVDKVWYQRWRRLIRSPNIWVETWNRMKIKANTLTWAWCCLSCLRCFSSIQADIVSWCPWF